MMEKKAYLRVSFSPELKSPVFVQGLAGFGNVGKIAAYLLMKFCGAKHFGELYSPSFPDFVSVTSKGICRLPRYDFHVGSTEKGGFIIMSGDAQPGFDDVVAHYELCDEVLNLVEKWGCGLIVSLGGVPITDEKVPVYVAATSSRLAGEFAQKGAVAYSKGRIVGPTGLLLGLAKERGLEGICVLGSTTGFRADRGAGFAVFKFLMKALGHEVKEGL